MNGQNAFKVGDIIISSGRPFRVTEIKKPGRKDSGKLYYRPYFETQGNKTLVCSVPLDRIQSARIRKPIEKETVKKLLMRIGSTIEEVIEADSKKAAEKLKMNDFEATVVIFKKAWLDSKNPKTRFSQLKKEILEESQERLIREIALVKETTCRKAKQELMLCLGIKNNDSTKEV